MKRVGVVRLGAIGDHIAASPLLRAYKRDGWHVTYITNERGVEVFSACPWIDRMVVQRTNQVPVGQLQDFWRGMEQDYDKFVNLSGTMEVSLLAMPDSELWALPHAERDARVGAINYTDYLMERGGYPELVGELPELHFTWKELAQARAYREKYANKFLVLWALSGSSFHKTYPEAGNVATAFLDAHPDAMTLTVGDGADRLLEWSHPQAKRYCWQWSIRRSLCMAQFADVVIGAETALLWAAACGPTPKIVFLSHSSEANLTQHWTNVTSLVPTSDCYPCHKLHYAMDTCPQTRPGVPDCVQSIRPEQVLNALESVYTTWKEARDGVLCGIG